MSLNVSILTTCIVIHVTVYKLRNKLEVINFRTAVVATEKRKSSADFYFGKIKFCLEEYMVLNVKTGNGKVGRNEN